jgi:hypothetical protein
VLAATALKTPPSSLQCLDTDLSLLLSVHVSFFPSGRGSVPSFPISRLLLFSSSDTPPLSFSPRHCRQRKQSQHRDQTTRDQGWMASRASEGLTIFPCAAQKSAEVSPPFFSASPPFPSPSLRRRHAFSQGEIIEKCVEDKELKGRKVSPPCFRVRYP